MWALVLSTTRNTIAPTPALPRAALFGMTVMWNPKFESVRLESASPSEVTLAEATLAQVRVPRPKGRPRQKPARVIADRGYDSDPLRQRLRRRGIELLVPYRENNQHRRYEDRRKLRRYKRRWIVERTNA